MSIQEGDGRAASRPRRAAKRLQIVNGSEDSRPVVRIIAGDMANAATRCEELLIAAGAQLYVRGTRLVRPVVETQIASGGQTTQTIALHEVDKIYLRDQMNRFITFERYDQRANDWLTANAPMEISETVLARKGEWSFKPVGGVINAPTLRPDGSVLSEPGYDERTGLILHGHVKLPKLPASPTRKDAIEALALLNALLVDFPFVGDAEGATCAARSVALSMLITPIVRGCMSVAPMHAVSAPAAGSGKSYLSDISAAIALGERCSVMSVSSNAEETEKRLGAKAMAGHPIISMDNCNGELGGDTLCQLVSQPICEIRVLGFSKMPRVVNRSCVFSNGNNLTLRGDLTRRTITCRLDTHLEKPFERTFTTRPFERVMADRGAYVAACLIIVQAFFADGRPDQGLTPFASFEDWSESVRGALVWLDCADPYETVATAQASDPDRQALSAFLTALQNDVGVGKGFQLTAAQILTKIEEPSQRGWRFPALREAVNGAPLGKVSSRALGRWLTGVEDKRVGNLTLKSAAQRSGYVGFYAEEMRD